MTTIWNDLLRLFYPEGCRLCRTPLVEGEQQLCLRCLHALPRTDCVDGVCVKAEQLFAGRFPFGVAFSFLEYRKESSVQRLIHSLKYHDNKELAYILGRLAANEMQQAGRCLAPVDLLLPVPLHPRKQRQRGYNQSEWIAYGLQSIWHLPVETQALRRIRPTETQTQRASNEQRRENVQGAFAVTCPEAFRHKHILLIDDVITSGSTLEACVQALRSVPGVTVSFFSLAIA